MYFLHKNTFFISVTHTSNKVLWQVFFFQVEHGENCRKFWKCWKTNICKKKQKKRIYYQTGLLQKQKGTEKGLTMSFGNVFWWFSQKNQNFFRIIMLLVPSVLIVRIETEINILFRLLKLLILQKLLKISALFFICVSPSRFSCKMLVKVKARKE